MSKLNTDLIRQINDAWLDVGIENKYIINPLEILRTDDPDEFHSRFTWLLMQPEYFSFACKHILNIELLPMQALMLKEIWNRKFPMLVGSRGLGKATRCVEPILTNDGWVKMGDITYDHKVYSRNGSLCNIVGIYPQGKRQVCRLEFADGRQIDCCEDHLWVMKKGTKEVTISTKDIINEGVRFDCPSGKWAYKYKLPLCEPIKYDNKDLLIDPYILGCMLGDGCMTTATPKIASNDEFIIDQFRDRLDGFKIELDPTNNNYTIVDIDKQLNKRFSRLGKAFYKKDGNRFLDKIRQLNVNVGCKDKFIPEEYKTSSIEDRMEIVRGLLDTDGTINKSGSIEFTNTCERLVDDLIDILRSLGISCIKSQDNREGQEHTLPSGKKAIRKSYFRVFINTSRPVFKLPRKLERLKKESTGREQYVSLISAEYTNEYDEMQCISVDSPDRTYITKDYIVTHNTFLLSLYCMLRAIFLPGRKIVVVGAAFRQSKFLHEYMETIWKNSPILRDICDSNSGPRRDVDMCRMNINGSVISALPIGDGSKIRGQRANDIVADEFASMSRDIFENVIAGFAAVSASPAENVKRIASEAKALELGIDIEDLRSGTDDFTDKSNQIILSGTAYYDFNHFADYWKKWRAIINTKGDLHKIKTDVFNGEDPPESFSWDDYSVIRIPVDLVPKGFMDEGQIARSKATVHNGIYMMEFSACFAKDSQGFFKRSLIESCVGNSSTPVKLNSGDVYFDPSLKGDSSKRYVMGVDPASEVDNFSIIILELHEDHRRVVHCWTTTRKDHVSRVQRGLTSEDNFYSYCARKIRELMELFPICHIALDAQGGGIAVAEALHDGNQLHKGEAAIWPIIDEDKPQPSDDEHGLHILEMCQFARYEWYSEANHGLRKDLEDKLLLFPQFDPVTIGLSIEQDKANNRLYDTLEDCVMEIEELKNELSLIEITQTSNGRDRWNTPEVKTGVGRKQSMRKDRYSSLLMANMASRQIATEVKQVPYTSYGGFASMDTSKATGPAFTAPNWFNDGIKGVY